MRYFAIIGDIKASKGLSGREEAQEKLKKILKYVNEVYQNNIAAKFLITLGDEFQGFCSI